MESKLKPAVFLPRTMGIFILLIILLSFIAGNIRGEMSLTLTGAVFLAVWIYSLAATLLLALIHFRRAHDISIRLVPEKIVCGEWTQVFFSENRETARGKTFFQFPGILVRCRVLLETKDGRRIAFDFKPEHKTDISAQENFQADKRGAYFSDYDEFAVFDILGFFRFAYRIPCGNSAGSGARLLVSPHSAEDYIAVQAKGGKSERHGAPIERTDEHIDHRPYVPGDDLRRINWKLFSHGGELFIRQGEREPPPHSDLTILIDTQYDALYSANSARDAVDLLCENALAIINNFGVDKNVQTGFTGQKEKSGCSTNAKEHGFYLALPAALPVQIRDMELPAVSEDRSVLILAMPRVTFESSALDRFLSKNENRTMELIFIYSAKEGDSRSFAERAEAAETCAALYSKHSCVRAQAVGVQ